MSALTCTQRRAMRYLALATPEKGDRVLVLDAERRVACEALVERGYACTSGDGFFGLSKKGIAYIEAFGEDRP